MAPEEVEVEVRVWVFWPGVWALNALNRLNLLPGDIERWARPFIWLKASGGGWRSFEGFGRKNEGGKK